MDIQEAPRDDQTDAKLRGLFKRNAPPADEAHLAAALRPEAALVSKGATARTPKRPPRRRALRIAAMTAGAVVLAAAIGVGSWQAASRLGGSDSVVVITDHATSTGSTAAADLQAQLTDGAWELRVDRQGDLESVRLPSDQLMESDYKPVEGGPVVTVAISEDGTQVAIEWTTAFERISATGSRKSVAADLVSYDLGSLFAGGRFVVWREGAGLQAEFTMYGSGLPIVLSYRGSLARAASAQSFDTLWTASVAAVEALGPTRVAITETLTVKALDEDSHLSSAEEGTFVTTAQQLLDPASHRARLTVFTADGRQTTNIVNGLDELQIPDVELTSSAKAPAYRVVRAQTPQGLPLPLWAGTLEPGYLDLLLVGSPSGKRVDLGPDGAGKQLSWKQTWDDTVGTYTVTLTLGAGDLPARIDISGEGTMAGTKVHKTASIEYHFETGATFADSDFSTELPEYATLAGWMYQGSLDHPYSDEADWGQYWLGPNMGDWSLAGAHLEIDSSELDRLAPERRMSLVYQRADALDLAAQIQVFVMAPDAQTAVDARQLGRQEVDLGVWTTKETTVAGKQATVYMGPAEASKSGGIDSVYVFLPDAFINVDLWDLADPQTLLDAIQGLSPDVAVETAAAMGTPDLLASYTTAYEGPVYRKVNVKVATQYASGVLLKPGQEYDFDSQLGPRTRDRGWSIPLGIVGPSTLEDLLGGGITQVATTLFNAAFEAGLEITERHNTSIYISHYPAGREAAVTAGSKNLRFVNDTAHDIWIAGESDGITTTFRIYGTSDGRKVHTSKGEFYGIIPKTTVSTPDEGLAKDKTVTQSAGQDGRTLDVRRTVTMPDGTVLHNDVFTSAWPMIPEQIRVGTSTK